MDNMAAYKHALSSQMRNIFFVSLFNLLLFILYKYYYICYYFHFRVRGSDSIQFLFGSTNPATDLLIPSMRPSRRTVTLLRVVALSAIKDFRPSEIIRRSRRISVNNS